MEFKFEPSLQVAVRDKVSPAGPGDKPPFDASMCPSTKSYSTAADDSGGKIALKFYPRDDVQETWAMIVSCNVALQELYEKLYPNEIKTIHFAIKRNMRLVIPDKVVILQMLNATYGELMKTNNTNNTMDMDFNSGGQRRLMTVGSDVGTIDVDSGGIRRLVTDDSIVTSTMVLDHVDSGGNRRLATEGSITSFARYPGTNWWEWNAWQCIPMFSREFRSKVTIITHGNPNCEAMWKATNDGCSTPGWLKSPFIWSHTPACQRHDSCEYSISYHSWKNIVDLFLNALICIFRLSAVQPL